MQIFRRFLFLILVAGTVSLYSCHPSNKKGTEEAKAVVYNAVVPSFDADSAYQYVKKQVDFGPRIPGTPAHEACAGWLTSKLKSFADSVTIQRTSVSTHGKTYPCVNIIGHFNPQNKERILLLAHWDTRAFADADSATKDQHFDGADDGGSGVGVLLELARQMHLKKPSLGIDILFTDVEDAGLEGDDNSWGLGTQYWARKAKSSHYKAKFGILLDMVGGKGTKFYREAVSRQYAGAQSKMVWDVANGIGYSDYFRYQIAGNIGGITDDHVFVNLITGIPTMDIIGLRENGDFMPWWHTIHDNMQIIDKNTLKAVGQTVLYVVYANPEY